MWYSENESINLDKPIFATNSVGDTYLLMPQIKEPSRYDIIGYTWFNLVKGKYGSSICFKTVESAMQSWGECEKFNGEITVTKMESKLKQQNG